MSMSSNSCVAPPSGLVSSWPPAVSSAVLEAFGPGPRMSMKPCCVFDFRISTKTDFDLAHSCKN
eukprot:638023-Karenia_brevis.AAC.1